MAFRITGNEFDRYFKSWKTSLFIFYQPYNPINVELFETVSELAPKYKGANFIILNYHGNYDRYWGINMYSYMHVFITKRGRILWTEFNPKKKDLEQALKKYGVKRHVK